jgi:hypothetical protein
MERNKLSVEGMQLNDRGTSREMDTRCEGGAFVC